uniref:Uncharacterized protein n=1 Tax=Anopheles darlingi TaxID=43151 RepID=A0A2M4CKE0_ANODA
MEAHVTYYPLEEGPERATECFAEPPTKRKFVCRPSPVHELASFHPVKDVIACDLVHGLYGSIMPRIMKMAKGTHGVLHQANALCHYLPAEAPRQIQQAKLAAITRKEYAPMFLVGIALFRVLDPPHYAIFMKLWLGVRMLGTDPKACFSPARSLLQDFVKLSQPVFHPSMPGTDNYSHMMLYMAQEAEQHGVQSMASFEEHIARFRNLQYESGVEDVLKDVAEQIQHIERNLTLDAPVPVLFTDKTVRTERFTINCGNPADAWFLTYTGQLAKAVGMQPERGYVVARVVERRPELQYANVPVPEELRLYRLPFPVPFAAGRAYITVTDIHYKMVCLESGQQYMLFPLLDMDLARF